MIRQVLAELFSNFVVGFPRVIEALIWLLIGFLVGKFIGWIVKEFLVKIKLDQFILEQKKFKIKLSDALSTLSRWIFYLLFIWIAAESLQITALTTLTHEAILFLAGAIEAAIIIIVGYSLAYYIKDQVIHTETFYGDVVGNLLFFLILYVSVALALPFVNIQTELINWILIIIVGSFGLGMAIAIGLGMKDVIKDVAEGYTKKFKKSRRKKKKRKKKK